MNALAPIEVTPLYSHDGMVSRGKSVRIEDKDEPNGWKEIGVVSPNYLLVPNSQAVDVVTQVAQLSGISDWQPRKSFFDGRRFVYSIATDTIKREVSPGDAIRFGLIVYNSYDGSRALSIGSYAEHLICTNGMTSETFFTRFSFRHHQGNVNWDDEVERAFLTILPNSREKLAEFASVLGKLKQKVMTTVTLSTLREEFLKELSAAQWGRVMDQFLLHEDHTVFGLLDACTRIFWHADKQTATDFRINSYATDALLSYTQNHLR